jgi:hypothetical protein
MWAETPTILLIVAILTLPNLAAGIFDDSSPGVQVRFANGDTEVDTIKDGAECLFNSDKDKKNPAAALNKRMSTSGSMQYAEKQRQALLDEMAKIQSNAEMMQKMVKEGI